jgi:hypothetical protein
MSTLYTITNETAVDALSPADEFVINDVSAGRTKKVTAAAMGISGGAPTTLTGDTTVSAAVHGGKTLLLGEVGGNASLTVTLPAATGSGLKFRFVVSVVNTSNYVIVVTGDDEFYGNIISNATGDTPDLTSIWPTAANTDTITLNATTTGGVAIGDWIEVEDILTDCWAVTGVTTSSGAEATPFSGS